jgi:hypothetical protein
MFRISLALIAMLSLAACGGGNRNVPDDAPVRVDLGGLGLGIEGETPAVLPFATGPIQKACQADGRKAASRARCGCVQAVADRELSSADQRRGAGYFKNPGKLQEVRQSDNAGNERFWRAWKAFGQSAAAVCKNS